MPTLQKPVVILEQQQLGSETKLLEEAIRQTFLGLIEANKIERKPAPVSKIMHWTGMWRLGWFFRYLGQSGYWLYIRFVSGLGGSVILSEFPELIGVEQELTRPLCG